MQEFLMWLVHQPLIPQIVLFYTFIGFILSLFGIARLIRWLIITPLSMAIFCILASECKDIHTFKDFRYRLIDTFWTLPAKTFTVYGKGTAIEAHKGITWVHPCYIMSTYRYYNNMYGE